MRSKERRPAASAEFKSWIKQQLGLAGHIKTILKNRKGKSKNVKSWKDSVEGIKSISGEIPAAVVREFCAVVGEAFAFNGNVGESVETTLPAFRKGDLDDEGELTDPEVDISNPTLRRLMVTQEQWDWSNKFLEDLAGRMEEASYKTTRKDQLHEARAKDVLSFPRWLRKTLMHDAFTQMLGQDSKKFMKVAELYLTINEEELHWAPQCLEESKTIFGELRRFMIAFEAIQVPQIVNEDQAEAIRFFFIPTSWGATKIPAWVKAWVDAALQAPGFQNKVTTTVGQIKVDLGAEGKAARAARDTPLKDWVGETVWRWLGKLVDWQKAFRDGALSSLEEKVVQFVERESKELTEAPEGETSEQQKERCAKLQKISEVITAVNAVVKIPVKKAHIASVNTAVATLKNKSNADEIKDALRGESVEGFGGEAFRKAVLSHKDKKLSKNTTEELNQCHEKIQQDIVFHFNDEDLCLASWNTGVRNKASSLKTVSDVLGEEEAPSQKFLSMLKVILAFKEAHQVWDTTKTMQNWNKFIPAAKAYDKAHQQVADLEDANPEKILSAEASEQLKPLWEQYRLAVGDKLKAKLDKANNAMEEAKPIMWGTADGQKWTGGDGQSLEDMLKAFKKDVAKDPAKLYKVAALPKKLAEDRLVTALTQDVSAR